MNHSICRGIGALSLLGPLAFASSAAAQEVAAAATLFDHGLAHMEARQFKVGCVEIAESQRLDPRPGTLYTLAQCEVRWGRTATAAARLGEYLRLYEHLSPEKKEAQTERPKVARTQLEQLSWEMPELTLLLSRGAPIETVVRRDGAIVATAALGFGFPVDPGEHVISTQVRGGPVREQKITIAKGENKRLVLGVNAAAPGGAEAVVTPVAGSTAALEADAGPSGRRVAAYVVGGAGVAGILVGSVLGAFALEKKATIDDSCGPGTDPKHPMDANACRPAGLTAAASLRPLGLGSTVGFAAGLAGVGAAVVMILTEPSAAKPTICARRSWISATVLSAGPGGALVGAQGAW